jgi:integrase
MPVYGDGRIYTRTGSKNLWIEYWFEGVQYRESTGTDDEGLAKVFLQKRIAEKKAAVAGLLNFTGPQRTTVEDLIGWLLDDYRIRQRRSLAETNYHLQPIRRLLEGCLAVEVNAAKLRWYVARRLDEGKSNATINRELAALRRAFNLAAQDGQVKTVPAFPMLPEHNVRRGFFEVHEFDMVVRNLPDYLQDLVRFAFLTGWRRGEVTGLTWEQIDLERRTVALPVTKNKDHRFLPLEGELWEIVERRRAERGLVPWVFHRYGQRIRAFRKAWATACTAAGLSGRHFHDFRRSAVRNLTRAGVPDKTAMDMTGHKTRSVFDRYDITSEDDLRKAAQKVQGYIDTVRVQGRKSRQKADAND